MTHLENSDVILVPIKLDDMKHTDPLYLLPTERNYANHIQSKKRRFIYVATRVLFRKILLSYFGGSVKDIRLSYKRTGRPILLNRQIPLEFSWAHTDSGVIFSFSKSMRLGVDMESTRRHVNSVDIARRYFSEIENQIINLCPSIQQRRDYFIRAWTKREAVFKALDLPWHVLINAMKTNQFSIYSHDCSGGESIHIHEACWNHHIITLATRKAPKRIQMIQYNG